MRLYLLSYFIMMSLVNCYAQSLPSARKIKANQLAKELKYRGKLSEAWQWKDTLGMNFLVLSVSAPTYESGDDEQSIWLYTYHYCKTDTGFRLLWKLTDGVIACPVDISVAFIPASTTITDLDKNGVAETTVIYKLACRGDVSPADMKLIMHEDSVKFALRGSMWSPNANGDTIQPKFPVTEKDVNLETLPDYTGSDDEYYKLYGRYRNEREFIAAPRQFLTFARRQWLKFAIESFE